MTDIHISKARDILDSGSPCSLSIVKANGSIIDINDAVSLRFDFYKGTRYMKLLRSGRIMTVRDNMIVKINDLNVFL